MISGARVLAHRRNAAQVIRREFAVKVSRHKHRLQAENGIILLSAYADRNGPSEQKDARSVAA